ncbi:MAG: hypothetical protein E6Q92_10690 [Burkholderiaceae bacterium]|jgi:hypothetical protein|nr:MAG: hypothetical protein E6Q92_10690 [Burkholderiaceae bacterium]
MTTPSPLALVVLAGLLAALAGPAGAAAVAGPGGTAEQGRRLVLDAPVAGPPAGTLDLVAVRLEAVDLRAGTVTVRGQAVPLHATALRVLGRGGQVRGPSGLRAGQAVRIAFDPAVQVRPASASAPAPARRIVLIHIDE